MPYECPICHTGFTHIEDFCGHINIHYDGKVFECPICFKNFKHKGTFNSHIYNHYGVEPYECPTCYKHYRYRVIFNEHLKIHIGEKRPSSNGQQKINLKRGLEVNDLKTVHFHNSPHICDLSREVCAQQKILNFYLNDEKACNKTFGCRISPKRVLKKHSNKKLDFPESKQHLQQNSVNVDKIDEIDSNKNNICFEVPIIKQEIVSEEDSSHVQTPACSYQNITVKEEPNEHADRTSVNLFDDSLVKEEAEII